MKRFFPYILILVIVVGLFLPTHFTYAQDASCYVLPDWMCSPTSLLAKIATVIFQAILALLSWLLWLSGTLLNFILKHTVVDLSDRLKGLTGINIAWKIIRDLMNIAFIFMLVYQGIMIIIDQENINKVKNFIFAVVLASLLINFSLFFTKVLIDASNIFTVGIYNSIIGPVGPEGCPIKAFGSATLIKSNCGLSDKIMSSLGLQTIYGKDADIVSFTGDKGLGSVFVMGIGSAILIIVSAFVFFAVSMMFIVRYITIIFLLMLSPIAYMGSALPFMGSYSKQWWESLKGQLIFPPLFMIMILISTTLIGSQGFIVTQESFSSLLTGGAEAPPFDTMNLLLNFIVVIGLIVGSLIMAKKWATSGSGYISTAQDFLTKKAGSAVFGGAARLGRFGGKIGMAGKSAEELEAKAAEGSWSAKLQLKAATGTWDARRSFVGEKTASVTGVNFGSGGVFNDKAGVGGAAATLADKKKNREGDMDSVMKSYVEKREWDKLAYYMMNKKPRFMGAEEWEKRQAYIYKKLNQENRVELEKALGTTAGTPGAAIVDRVRGKLPLEEQIRIYADRKDWAIMATWLRGKNNQDQEYIYKKLSARDRVELDKAIADPLITRRLQASLSTEEMEKTTEASGKAAGAEKSTRTRSYIQQYAIDRAAGLPNIDPAATDPNTGLNYSSYHASINDAIVKLKPSDANKLKHEARINAEIIPLLSVRHLGNLMKDGDLTPDEIREIRSNATAAQLTWMNHPDRVADWTP